MKKIAILLGLLMASVLFAQANEVSHTDVITLKDGKIIKGIITENKPNQSIKVKVGLNTFSYKHNEIKSLTKEKILKPASQKQFQNSGKNNGGLGKISPVVQAEMDRLEDEKGSPGVAFLFSLFLTGGGQFYNGEVVAGVVHLLVAGAGAGMLMGGAIGTAKNRSDATVSGRYFVVSIIGVGVVIINAVWSIVDAPLTAVAQNKEINQKIRDLRVSKQSSPEESVKFVLGPALGEKSIDGVFLGLSYGF